MYTCNDNADGNADGNADDSVDESHSCTIVTNVLIRVRPILVVPVPSYLPSRATIRLISNGVLWNGMESAMPIADGAIQKSPKAKVPHSE